MFRRILFIGLVLLLVLSLYQGTVADKTTQAPPQISLQFTVGVNGHDMEAHVVVPLPSISFQRSASAPLQAQMVNQPNQ